MAQARPPVEAGIVQPVLLAVDAGLTDDYLICRATDSDPVVYESIFVAKPKLLRKTPWDGQTRGQVRYVYDAEDSTKRTAYDVNDPPGTPEAERNKRTEMISSEYLIGDEILAVGVKTGIVVGETAVTMLALTEGRGWTVFFGSL